MSRYKEETKIKIRDNLDTINGMLQFDYPMETYLIVLGKVIEAKKVITEETPNA